MQEKHKVTLSLGFNSHYYHSACLLILIKRILMPILRILRPNS